MVKSNKEERNSTIELLRILAVLIIIGAHYVAHGGVALKDMPFSLNKYLLQLTVSAGVGLNIFLVITGYYQSQSAFKLEKVLSFAMITGFYSVLFYGVAIYMGEESFVLSRLIERILAAFSGDYWFVTAYMVMYVLSPFVNHIFRVTSKRQLQLAICVMFVMWSVIPTITHYGLYGYPLGNFLLMYCLGAYIRKYPESYLNMSSQKGWGLILLNVGVLCGSVLVFDAMGYKMAVYAGYFWETNSVFCISLAVGLLTLGLKCKPKKSKVINAFSTTSLGIYIIHDNIYVRTWLWQSWVRSSRYVYEGTLFLHMIASVLIVFIVCGVMEMVRKKIFQYTLDPFMRKYIRFPAWAESNTGSKVKAQADEAEKENAV